MFETDVFTRLVWIGNRVNRTSFSVLRFSALTFGGVMPVPLASEGF